VTTRLSPLAARYLFDVFVVALAAAAAAELVLTRDHADAPHGSLWLLLPLVVLYALPLIGRRWFAFAAPASIFAVAAASSFASGQLVQHTLGAFLAFIAGCFLLGAADDRRLARAGLALVLAGAFVVELNDPTADLAHSGLPWVWLVFTLAWGAGYVLSRKFRQIAVAEERAERLERQREAVTAERARIGRELHDVVAHSVSVMTIQAGAVRRLLRPDQERERQALATVEQIGREALAEMRRMVDVMKHPEEPPRPRPSRASRTWHGWSPRCGRPASRSRCASRAARRRSRPASTSPPTGSSRRA
jgi:signal transduction histidine kinase